MKFFKVALIAVLSALIFVSSATPFFAKAETLRYAYADDYADNAEDIPYFCKEKSLDSAIFAIPKTYCVEILKEEGEWYQCRYARNEGVYSAVYGYCLKSRLTPIEEPLENEYLNNPVDVTFTATSSSQTKVFTIKLTLPFYGNGNMNASELACVYYDGEFGYVAEHVIYPKNVLPESAVSTNAASGANSVNATLITAVVITVIAVVAVVVLYFASKRPKLPPKSD